MRSFKMLVTVLVIAGLAAAGCSKPREETDSLVTTSKQSQGKELDGSYPHKGAWKTEHMSFIASRLQGAGPLLTTASTKDAARDATKKCAVCHANKHNGHPMPSMNCTFSCHKAQNSNAGNTQPVPPVPTPDPAPNMDNLCLDCHGDLVEPTAGMKNHAPVTAGQCLICHDVKPGHVNEDPSAYKPTLRTMGESCNLCHFSEHVKGPKPSENAKKAGCMSCHDAHKNFTDVDYQNSYPHAQSWIGDHMTSIEEKLAQGTSIGEAGKSCFGCHQTKKNNGPKLKSISCAGACHSKGSAEPVVPKPNGDISCVGCHDGKQMGDATQFGHFPATIGQCASCHVISQAHADGGDEPTPQTKPYLASCAVCHPAKHQNGGPVIKEETLKKGGCVVCHDPHVMAAPTALEGYPHAATFEKGHMTFLTAKIRAALDADPKLTSTEAGVIAARGCMPCHRTELNRGPKKTGLSCTSACHK